MYTHICRCMYKMMTTIHIYIYICIKIYIYIYMCVCCWADVVGLGF